MLPARHGVSGATGGGGSGMGDPRDRSGGSGSDRDGRSGVGHGGHDGGGSIQHHRYSHNATPQFDTALAFETLKYIDGIKSTQRNIYNADLERGRLEELKEVSCSYFSTVLTLAGLGNALQGFAHRGDIRQTFL